MQDADVDPVLHDILREASRQPHLPVRGTLLPRDTPGRNSTVPVGAILSVEARFVFRHDGSVATVARPALAEAPHG